MISAINEISRVAQLVNNGPEILDRALLTYNVSMSALIVEIMETVKGVNTETATESAGWYNVANGFAKELATEFGTTIEIAAGIISAVSPRMPWLRNKTVARTILAKFNDYAELSALAAAKEIGLALSTNVAMAIRIARGESIADTLTGTKRRSFFNNIVDPMGNDSVTVDTWMIEAAVKVSGMTKKTAEKFVRSNETALGGTGAGYIVIAESVRAVAIALGMTANAVQAIYWCDVSGSFEGGRTDIG